MKAYLPASLAICLFASSGVLAGGSHHHNPTVVVENWHTVKNVTNLTGISSDDLAAATAMSGAAASLVFSRATTQMQWALGGSCVDSSSDDCGFAGGISKFRDGLSVTGILSGASDDRMISFSLGGTF